MLLLIDVLEELDLRRSAHEQLHVRLAAIFGLPHEAPKQQLLTQRQLASAAAPLREPHFLDGLHGIGRPMRYAPLPAGDARRAVRNLCISIDFLELTGHGTRSDGIRRA